jgi:chromosome partitioning protein
LKLIAGNSMTNSAQMILGAQDRSISFISELLKLFARDNFDFILFDTSPSVGGLQERALWAADMVIVPTATEYASLDALAKTIETMRALRDSKGWQGGLMGILPTFFDATRESKSSMEDLQTEFGGQVLAPIHKATVLRECWSEGKTIFEHAPESRSAEEYMTLAKSLLKY